MILLADPPSLTEVTTVLLNASACNLFLMNTWPTYCWFFLSFSWDELALPSVLKIELDPLHYLACRFPQIFLSYRACLRGFQVDLLFVNFCIKGQIPFANCLDIFDDTIAFAHIVFSNDSKLSNIFFLLFYLFIYFLYLCLKIINFLI